MKRFILIAGLLGVNSIPTQETDLRPKIQTLTKLVNDHIVTENTLYTTDLYFGDIKTSETAFEEKGLLYRVNVVNDETLRPGFFVVVNCKSEDDRRCKNNSMNHMKFLSLSDYGSDGKLELFLHPRISYVDVITCGNPNKDARMEKRAVKLYENLLDRLLEFYKN